MFIFASQMIRLIDVPYSEYWLPLAMGMGVGFMFLLVARTFGRRETIPAPPMVRATSQEYDPFVHGSPTDQRKAYRRSGNPIEVYYAPSDNKDDAHIGWVFDRSVGGLGLLTSVEVPTDIVLAVRPGNAPVTTPWVEVHVRSCRATKEGFELGCQFVKTPPWSVLLMFG